MTYWTKQQVMSRHPGTHGVVAVLWDHTTSMPEGTHTTIHDEIRKIASSIPSFRVFGFAYGVEELCLKKAYFIRSRPPEPPWETRNKTFIGRCLEQIAELLPQQTIIFSDGGAADKTHALAMADQITGRIDCFFCKPERHLFDETIMEGAAAMKRISVESAYRRLISNADPGFMERLARRGRGRYVCYRPYLTDLGAELQISTHDARQQVEVLRGTVVHHHYLPTEHRIAAAFRRVS
jgi:hypothetical protein